ncbi:MAG: 4Fe-4S dicluster domain-containing protein [Lentisphaeria bacterium]|nr:4Fe-4S dicluster domain-containing protein [Lentisphaeria bacterium]
MKKLRIFRIIISTLMFLMICAAFSGICDEAAKVCGVEFFPAFAAGSVMAIFWIILALVRGRAFCSFGCPLGFMQDVTGFLGRKLFRKKCLPQKPYRFLRYSAGVFLLVLFLFGFSSFAGFFEPFSVAGRFLNTWLRPLFQFIGNVTGLWDYSEITPVVPGVAIASAVILLLIVIAAFFRERLFCNTLCPAGFLLGVFSRIARYRLKFSDKCLRCKGCEKVCKAGCIDVENGVIDNERCVVCGNCQAVCKFSGLTVVNTFLPQSQVPEKLDRKRRLFLGGIAIAGVAAAVGKNMLKEPLGKLPCAPPGAGNVSDFNQKCTGCQLCIANCTGKVLTPAGLEYGIAGIGQPRLLPEKGFCDYNCNKCSSICPAGALTPLSLAEKKRWRVGKVTYFRERCVVVTDGEACGACAEHCPTGALDMVDYKDGLTIPKVTPELCIGCGGCEFICPVRPLRAVEVSGVAQQSLIVDPEVLQSGKKEKTPPAPAVQKSADDAFPF